MSRPAKAACSSSEDLYLACCRGDEEAWQSVRSHILGIARSSRWDLYEMAEDIAQAVCLKLLEKGLSQVHSPGGFRSFIYQCTVNYIKDHFIAARRCALVTGAHLDYINGGRSLPWQRPARVEERALARIELSRLRAPYPHEGRFRAWVEYKAGMFESYQDVARHLDVPLGRAALQMMRARRAFMECRAGAEEAI